MRTAFTSIISASALAILSSPVAAQGTFAAVEQFYATCAQSLNANDVAAVPSRIAPTVKE